MLDVAVIGGGVVGGMVAREFTKYTKSVVILEALSGIISPLLQPIATAKRYSSES